MNVLDPPIKESFADCVIVGNSKFLLGRELGSTIDDFECVVRLNAAPIHGFENHVGSKTTIRVLNSVLQEGSSLEHSTTPENYIETIRDQTVLLKPSSKERESTAKSVLEKNNNEVYTVSEPFRVYLEDFKDAINVNLLSTGLFSTLCFLHIIDGVSLIGFDFYSDLHDSKHYWENFSGGNTSRHDFQVEKLVFNQLLTEYNLEFLILE